MKKLWKKLVAVTTAVMMAITLLPAMANASATDGKGSVTIKKNGATTDEYLGGAKFSFYKLASISNTNGADWKYTVESPYNTEALLGSAQDANLDTLPVKEWESKISALAAVKATPVAESEESVKSNEGSTGPTELSLGIYLVKETQTPSGFVASKPFIVSVPSTDNYNGTPKEGTKLIYDITAQPKNSSVDIKKTIETAKNVSIGEYVKYKVNSVIPNYSEEYTEPKFNIYDKMSEGLTWVNNTDYPLTVMVNGTKIEAGADTYKVVTEGLSDDKTFEIQFAKAFLQNDNYKGKSVEVTYYAQVNEKAAYENTNQAGIIYNNAPGSEADAETDEKKVYTYTIDLTKTGDKDDDVNGLNGAEFTLTAADENMITLVVNGDKVEVNGKTTDSFKTVEVENQKGKLIIKGLKAGTYTLTETKSPKGYSLLKNPVTIVITAKDDGTLESATVDGTNATVEAGTVQVEIQNKSGFSLPSTGGMGTYLFTIAGLVIMAGAAFLLIASKRRRA